MKSKRVIAGVLAAMFAFAATPVWDTGAAEFVWSRPAYAQAGDTDGDAALHLLPLMTDTQFFEEKDENGELLRSSFSSVGLYEEYDGVGSNIAAALAEYNMTENSSFQRMREKLTEDAKRDRWDRQKDGAAFFGPYENRSDIYVRRADTRVVSFQEDYYEYLGGVHGLGGIVGKNFDAYSGKELKLTDIFTDVDGMAEAIKKQLMSDYPNASFMSTGGGSMKASVDEAAKSGSLIWTLDPRGVTFYFNPYKIGSYAEGIFATTLLFSEYPDIYKKDEDTGAVEWRGSRGYCMELRPNLTFRLSNGSRDGRLSVSSSDTHIVIGFDGRYEDPAAVREIRPTVVNCFDGRRYLYVDYSGNKKDFRLRVYDLNGSGARLVGEFPMTRLATSPESAASRRRWYVMTDPDYFYMTATEGNEFQKGARLRCRVGEDGSPEVYEVEGAAG